MVKLAPNSIITSDFSNTYYLKFANGIFVVLYNEKMSLAVASYLKEEPWSGAHPKDTLDQLKSKIPSANSLKAKLVGSKKCLNDWAQLLKSQKIEILAQVEILGPSELFYQNSTGRIRLAEVQPQTPQSMTPPASKNRGLSPKAATDGHEKSPHPAIYDNRNGSQQAAYGNQKKVIKVLIVDDSTTIRNLLNQIFSTEPQIQVVASTGNPLQVEELIKKHRPDVMTLDIHMPEMDGVSLLKKIYPIYRVPAVMITSVTLEEGQLVFEALEKGAVDYIKKPALNELDDVMPIIIQKVITAANANISQKSLAKSPAKITTEGLIDISRIIAIGSSTGGTEALREILTQLPAQIPPILITQHIPPVFSKALAERLDKLCEFTVSEAVHGEPIVPNHVYIAPGGHQMKVRKVNGKLQIEINDDPPVNRHKPSVNYLFNSLAQTVGRKCIGVILTGMGDDGAQGLLKLRQAGARTIGQDQATSVVYGMPREAFELGAVEKVLPLSQIPQELISLVSLKQAV